MLAVALAERRNSAEDLNRLQLITSLILDHPTCLDCLATKAGMGLAAVEAALDRIATALLLHRAPARCYTCGVTTAVVFVGRTDRV